MFCCCDCKAVQVAPPPSVSEQLSKSKEAAERSVAARRAAIMALMHSARSDVPAGVIKPEDVVFEGERGYQPRLQYTVKSVSSLEKSQDSTDATMHSSTGGT